MTPRTLGGTVQEVLDEAEQKVFQVAQSHERGGFVWIKDAGDFLQTYESNRDQYPTFESFFPKFIDFMDQYAKQTTL